MEAVLLLLILPVVFLLYANNIYKSYQNGNKNVRMFRDINLVIGFFAMIAFFVMIGILILNILLGVQIICYGMLLLYLWASGMISLHVLVAKSSDDVQNLKRFYQLPTKEQMSRPQPRVNTLVELQDVDYEDKQLNQRIRFFKDLKKQLNYWDKRHSEDKPLTFEQKQLYQNFVKVIKHIKVFNEDFSIDQLRNI